MHWRDGLVVTAHHTIETDGEITLAAPDGGTYAARVAGRDPALDIAVLRGASIGVPVADIADEGELRVGHLVLAVGAGPRASVGIVSALDVRGHAAAGDTFVVDLTLYPGFSGGPLIDVHGRVVGITTSGASRHLQAAVRVAAVANLVEQVISRGTIPRAYLGLGTQPLELPEALRERLSLAQRTALVVVNVKPGSPAATGGLIIGDIVLAIAGHATATPDDLLGVLRPDRVGSVVTVSVLRGGEARDLQVTVGERPPRG